jgi:chromosome segregation ATPase
MGFNIFGKKTEAPKQMSLPEHVAKLEQEVQSLQQQLSDLQQVRSGLDDKFATIGSVLEELKNKVLEEETHSEELKQSVEKVVSVAGTESFKPLEDEVKQLEASVSELKSSTNKKINAIAEYLLKLRGGARTKSARKKAGGKKKKRH